MNKIEESVTRPRIKPKLKELGDKYHKFLAVYSYRVFDLLMSMCEHEEVSYMIAGVKIPIYKITLPTSEIIITANIPAGAPVTASFTEELAVNGFKEIFFFGSCGVLEDNQNNFSPFKLVIPIKAYRDEGTSSHYSNTETKFTNIVNARELAEICNKNDIDYEFVVTWTTDGFFRETPSKIRERKKCGCTVVEMECTAGEAATRYINQISDQLIKNYHIFYTADIVLLDGTRETTHLTSKPSTESTNKLIKLINDVIQIYTTI